MYLERGQARAHAAQMRAIDAVRSGTVFAHDLKSWQRYLAAAQMHQRQLQGQAAALSPANLERVLMAMAATNPDIVAVRRAPVH